MIDIRNPPEVHEYQPQPTDAVWVKTCLNGDHAYLLKSAPTAFKIAGRRKWEPDSSEGAFSATLSLLESGAILASFPLRGPLPGKIEPDPFSVWFFLDAPAIIAAGVFGREIRIAAGRHLMASCLGTWIVFFRPIHHESSLQQNHKSIKSSQHAFH